MCNVIGVILCWNTCDVITKIIMVRLHHKFKSYQTFQTIYRVAGLKGIREVLYYTGTKPQQRTIAGKFIFL